MQILREKSGILSEQLRRHWFKKDITVDFDYFNEDREIGMAIESDGSFDPPSRRSQGFSCYLSLFAKLAELASKENIVLLLDDPAMSLHPMAQKNLRQLLDSQQYQIVLATHLPFLIDPEHLERIRVVRRTPAGSQVEQDWEKVEQSLLPVWGGLVGSFTGRIWLLVEGKTDMICCSAASKACEQARRAPEPRRGSSPQRR
jgi:predicted ATP-dependent endonuclease of OLD family